MKKNSRKYILMKDDGVVGKLYEWIIEVLRQYFGKD